MLDQNLGPVGQALLELRNIITTALESAVETGELAGEVPAFIVEIPADTSHGDFASNAAMAGAKSFRKPPRAIAEAIVNNIILENTVFSKVEIAGPGFLNFFVTEEWFVNVLNRVSQEGDRYGRTSFGCLQKVMVEFVSANPTGPMHIGNARGGAIGDSLASALDWAGYDVTREFYVNDAGNQIEKFAKSLDVRYLQQFKGEDAVEFPEDGYHGADITESAKEYIAVHGDKLLNVEEKVRRDALVEYALPRNIQAMRDGLARYRINFDCWFHESALYDSGAIKEIVEILKTRGLTYEKEGAVWYKATEFGSEKDEVLIRANGNPTYFTADIAYHKNKFVDRGYSKCINIWGADHHGHVARLKGAMNAVGADGDKLDIVLMQLVRLTRGGEMVRMSKRTGNAITLTNLLDDVPIDAARFFFNMREAGSTLDFDLDLAVEESSQNPVYYIQYAYARVCSIVKNLAAEGIQPRECSNAEWSLLVDPAERELVRAISMFPEEIIIAARQYDPARLTHFAIDIATKYHRFYNNCHCKVEDEKLMQARISLCLATKQVIKNLLTMLKIDCPETM